MAVGALPVLAASPAPLQDWGYHLARVHIEAGLLLTGDPFWARFYRLDTFLVPNAALDLGILGLHRAGLGIEAAGQLFLLLTYAVFVTGFCGLARRMDAMDAQKPVLAVLLFYCLTLFWGLVNYMLGVGLMLVLLALWLPARGWRRLAIAAGGMALLLLVHLVAALVFAGLLACFDLPRLVQRKAPLAGCASAPAAMLVVAMRATPGQSGGGFGATYTGAGSPLDFLAWKLGLWGKTLLGGGFLQDGLSLVALVVAACVIGRGRPRWSLGAAFAVAALFALALAAPERLGKGSLLDLRLAVLPLIVGAACARLSWSNIRVRRVAVVVLALTVIVRTSVLAWEWHNAGKVFAAFDREVEKLPAGSLMMMAYGTKLQTLTWQQVWSPPIIPIAAQSVAHGLFMPAVFAIQGQHPIVLRDEFHGWEQPWDLTDAAHLHAAAARIAPLCDGRFAGVFLTVLYPGDLAFLPASSVLHVQRDFLVLDGCRLAPHDPA